MKNYDAERKEIMLAMFSELDKQEEKSNDKDKDVKQKGFYDKDSYERQTIINKYNKRLLALKKKYGKDTTPQKTDSQNIQIFNVNKRIF